MAEKKAIVTVPTRALDVAQLRQWVHDLDLTYRTLMQKETDYGVIPGTPKPTLLKPGAELLRLRFGLAARSEVVGETENWDQAFYEVKVRVSLYNEAGECEGDGLGSCNSWEKKYRYRWEGEGPKRQRVLNEDWAEQRNTILKMAEKRAFVDAILRRTGASRIFTQDLEDINGVSSAKGTVPKPSAPPAKPSGAKPTDTPKEEPTDLTPDDFWKAARAEGFYPPDNVYKALAVVNADGIRQMGYRVALERLKALEAEEPA